MAIERSKQFRNMQQIKIDQALEIAKIQKLNASAAKDRQEVRDSIQQSFEPIKKF